MDQEMYLDSKSVRFRDRLGIHNEGKRKVKDDFQIFVGVVCL